MIDFTRFNSLIDIALYFDTPLKCKKALADARWSDGVVVCPFCGGVHCSHRKDGSYRCNYCKQNFSVLVGTIFENTKISLVKWFMAMYLVSSHKKGVSSCQLSRDLGVTQKTAWYILHKVRTLYAQDSSMLHDYVECDEMYLGGRETNKHISKKTEKTQGRSVKTKTPIFGMAMPFFRKVVTPSGKVKVVSDSKVKAMVVPDAKSETLYDAITKNIKVGSIVVTDELGSYKCIDGLYKHEYIKHSSAQYVYGIYTTNSIEGFWGQFKRMVFGIYHFVGRAYVQRYIDEAVYRWNTKHWTEQQRFADMFCKAVGKVQYKDVRLVVADAA